MPQAVFLPQSKFREETTVAGLAFKWGDGTGATKTKANSRRESKQERGGKREKICTKTQWNSGRCVCLQLTKESLTYLDKEFDFRVFSFSIGRRRVAHFWSPQARSCSLCSVKGPGPARLRFLPTALGWLPAPSLYNPFAPAAAFETSTNSDNNFPNYETVNKINQKGQERQSRRSLHWCSEQQVLQCSVLCFWVLICQSSGSCCQPKIAKCKRGGWG